MVQKKDLIQAIHTYKEAVRNPRVSDQRTEELFGEAEKIVPHANLLELMFWAERERTDEEVIDESLLREEIWRNEGLINLLLHIRSQMKSAINDPEVVGIYRECALKTLERVSLELASIKGN